MSISQMDQGAICETLSGLPDYLPLILLPPDPRSPLVGLEFTPAGMFFEDWFLLKMSLVAGVTFSSGYSILSLAAIWHADDWIYLLPLDNTLDCPAGIAKRGHNLRALNTKPFRLVSLSVRA